MASEAAQAQTGHQAEQEVVRAQSIDDYLASFVKTNFDNLAKYFVMLESHAKRSFSTSIWFGAVGFLFVIAGLTLAFSTTPETKVLSASTISTMFGVITELISAVFFYLYHKTIQQMKGYHGSLLVVQNVLLSFKLVGDTPKDSTTRGNLITDMIRYLLAHKEESENWVAPIR